MFTVEEVVGDSLETDIGESVLTLDWFKDEGELFLG